MKRIRSYAKKLIRRLVEPGIKESAYLKSGYPYRLFFWQAFTALRVNRIEGAYAEFGVYGAGSFSIAYRTAVEAHSLRRFWGFDSFKGLPEIEAGPDAHPRWSKGRFAASEDDFHAACVENGVPRSAYDVVPGFFSDTLDKMSPAEPPTEIAFAHVDCDLYTSTVSVLNFLEPRLKNGMIVSFDDYHLWSSDQISGERRAFLELWAGHPKWHFEPFMPVSWHGASFVVEDRALHPGSSSSRL